MEQDKYSFTFEQNKPVKEFIFITRGFDGTIWVNPAAKGGSKQPIDMSSEELGIILEMLRHTAKYFHSIKSKVEQLETIRNNIRL